MSSSMPNLTNIFSKAAGYLLSVCYNKDIRRSRTDRPRSGETIRPVWGQALPDHLGGSFLNKQTIKKLVPAVLSVLTAAGILCACQQSAPPDAQAGQGEQSLPVLKIGVDTLRPFFYIDENGNCAGIDAEIAPRPAAGPDISPTSSRSPGRTGMRTFRTGRWTVSGAPSSRTAGRTTTAGRTPICKATCGPSWTSKAPTRT